MKKSDIKQGAKISAVDIDSGSKHSGQITRVTNNGFFVKWEHEDRETSHPFDGKEYEQIELID